MTQLLISNLDRARLGNLLERWGEFGIVDRRWLHDLEYRIDGAEYADSPSIPDDVVTMNSTVCLRDLDSDRLDIYAIVYPRDADRERGRLSILDPLAMPLLGKRVGDVVCWPTPSGRMQRRIEKLLFQPERAGLFAL